MQKRFSNLDGLRFVAAFVVVICHFDLIKTYFGIPKTGGRFFSNSAQMAVTFFFVLSGFLITYLLLKEKMADYTDRISLRRFYKKRILRIWPLYYLLVILAFFVFRQLSFLNELPVRTFDTTSQLADKRLPCYILFFPNYSEYRFGAQPYLAQTWSLAVEEFFYLFFPLGLYFIRMRHILTYLLVLAILFMGLSLAMRIPEITAAMPFRLRSALGVLFDKYRVYSFAMGGLAAWFLLAGRVKYAVLYSWLCRKSLSNLLALLLSVLVLTGFTFSIITQQLYSVLFALFIFLATASGINFFLLNNRVMMYLGKISYGIYMLHMLATIVFLQIMKPSASLSLPGTFLLMAGAVLMTVLLAVISYELFEKFFLQRKSNS